MCGSPDWPTVEMFRVSSSDIGSSLRVHGAAGPMTKAFVADIHGFVPCAWPRLVPFGKCQRKDDLAQQFLARFPGDEGVLFVGRAQEKAGRSPKDCRLPRRSDEFHAR
jgi:hypothetical protein